MTIPHFLNIYFLVTLSEVFGSIQNYFGQHIDSILNMETTVSVIARFRPVNNREIQAWKVPFPLSADTDILESNET